MLWGLNLFIHDKDCCQDYRYKKIKCFPNDDFVPLFCYFESLHLQRGHCCSICQVTTGPKQRWSGSATGHTEITGPLFQSPIFFYLLLIKCLLLSSMSLLRQLKFEKLIKRLNLSGPFDISDACLWMRCVTNLRALLPVLCSYSIQLLITNKMLKPAG